MSSQSKPIEILFVCMGNICRSPSAEAVMNAYINDRGLQEKIICDSAGTIAHHAGEPADARMQTHANKRGFRLTSISRQLVNDDFNRFEYIIGMDDDNMINMQPFCDDNRLLAKASKMTDYCLGDNPGYVPDPYYGGSAGFEKVLDLLEDACNNLLNIIVDENELL